MMYVIIVSVIVLSVCHLSLGLLSVIVGMISSIHAEVWLAHSVSPIWSGAFFIVTGILGFACAKRKSAYMIMCFTAFSIVSLVTAIVSIQLLRLGLVNQTTDGQIYQKTKTDVQILIALGAAGVECLICVVSSFVSCRLARAAKKELCNKREGMFHVQGSVKVRSDSTGHMEVRCLRGQAELDVNLGESAPDTSEFEANGVINPSYDPNLPLSENNVRIHVMDDSGREVSPKVDRSPRTQTMVESNCTINANHF